METTTREIGESVAKSSMKKQAKTRLFTLLRAASFFSVFFFHTYLQADSLTIQNNIFLSQPGDYVTLSKGNKKVFLFIKDVSESRVLIEMSEFASLSQKDKALSKNIPWKDLIHQLHSPRKLFLISLTRNNATAFFLETKTQKWKQLNTEAELPLVVKLLQLPLKPVPPHLLKKSGKDKTLWQPKVVIEGSPTQTQSIYAKLATWPQDVSALSGKKILMYFADHNVSVFPLWISIDTPTGPVIVHAIDTGHNANSPYHYEAPNL